MAVSMDLGRLAERPIKLTQNTVQTFYEGGRLWRQFRGEPAPRDDHWAEDWVGSCIETRQRPPDGTVQGLSAIDMDGRRVSLRALVQALPEAMIGRASLTRWGADPRVQVKLVAPRDRVPMHVHPDAEFARQHFGMSCGKAEAWIVLEAAGTNGEPAVAGIGFREDVTETAFKAAVEAQDSTALLDMVHWTAIQAGSVIFVRPGVPHYIGGGTFFIEVQEPADLTVLAEWRGFVDGPAAATSGLDPATALSCFHIEPRTRLDALEEAFQRQRSIRTVGANQEIALLDEGAEQYFDARRMDIGSTYAPEDGRYYVGVVVGGAGSIEGPGWRESVRRGDTFVCAASLEHRFQAEGDLLQVIRALGPKP